MKSIEVLYLLTIVSTAPLLIDILGPKLTSIQNIKGPDYRGMAPPPWIAGGFWGQPHGPISYGFSQGAPSPGPSPFGQQGGNFNQEPESSTNFPDPQQNTGGDKWQIPIPVDFNGSASPNPDQEQAEFNPSSGQANADPSIGDQATFTSSGNSDDEKTPVNDSAIWDNNSPPPTFQFEII